MLFAEIILPLPLRSTFTYKVPDDLAEVIERGSRVLVQFGKRKYYTGLVANTHSDMPQDYEVKEIMAVLDPAPVIRYPQLNLWDWISSYYLCSIGEVYKAALPTGLKPESETFVSLNKEFDTEESIQLTDRQKVVLSFIEQNGRVRISDIIDSTKIKNATQIVSSLMELGIVEVDEKVIDRYKPKKIAFISLCCERNDNETLHSFFSALNRSRKQEKTLIAYLDLSGWMHPTAPLRDVTKEELIAKSEATPPILKALIDKGILKVEKRTVNRFVSEKKDPGISLSPLSESQTRALDTVIDSFRDHNVSLLHGVTGSGKTEIYTHLINRALGDKSQVLYLVPEISLTTQLTDRLRKVFGDRLLVYHSKFSDNERVDIWKKLLTSNEPLIVLGARSSVFLPFSRLGLVIVDEEHEASFKQYDPAPRYNARDVAIVLASMHGAKTLLGSATPSVETYHKALNGKYGLATLTSRFRDAALPEVVIVDMKEQRKKKLNKSMMSSTLLAVTKRALSAGKQAIMFQNRRGFAPVVICRQCGWTPKCENCDVSQVYHKNTDLLKCHYCGSVKTLPRLCPACGQNSIDIFGYGTERIAEEMHKEFDGFRVARMDLDTTRNKDAYQEIIEEFGRHDTDILVGTQMVSKGLDFNDVTVVGIINADTLLNFPDFRSNERAFNMMAQVAGRAGRRAEKGEVIIQTSRPDDPILGFVARHDYQAYYNSEIKERERYFYPPFSKIINIYIKNRDDVAVDKAAVALAMQLRSVFGDRVMGPEKPFVAKVANWHLQSIMLKVEAGASMKKVKKLLLDIYESVAQDPSIRTSIIYYDVDPS